MSLIKGMSKDKPKRKSSLLQMVTIMFEDVKVVKALEDYLASRKEQHNLPSKVAWEKQLQMLLKVEPADRANMVESSTIKGYRQIVYLDSYKPSRSTCNVARTKATESRSQQKF